MLAGPFGTRLLADHGADVIKVQTDGKLVGYVNDGYFTTWNRNKRGVTLNLGTAEGRAIARQLVERVDVVVDNFSARVMRQWGLDDDTLRTINPDLIIAHLSGMGHSGPYEHYVSYGPTAQALAGITAMMTDRDGAPVGVGFSYSDHVAGLTLATAILAALAYRDATGTGQVIDLSQFESTASFLGPEYAIAARDAAGGADVDRFSMIARCRGEDRWLAIAAPTDNLRRAVAAIVGPTTDLSDAVARWAARHDPHEAAAILQAAGVPASVVADAEDLTARDAHLR
ncbi:MAG: CoA transferase, partial [Dehalococcoidia bacterium]|nr:CoA transferase [Dehalococcoidia bacterium]